MKKIALFCVAAAMTAGVFAADMMFTFSSSGDKYADGTPVQDGEVYALVWSDDGHQFGGINNDGTVVSAGDEIALTAVAENGGCRPTLFILDEGEVKKTGTYQIYLLDTREFAADGTAGAPKGRAADGSFPVVNGYAAVTSATFKKQAEAVTNNVATEGAGGSTMGFAADTPDPVITAVEFKGDKVVLTVANVVAYVPYTISCGSAPNSLTKQQDFATVLSLKDGVLTITVNNPGENRFFRVVSK